MDSKFLLSDIELIKLARSIYNVAEHLPNRRLLLDGQVKMVSHKHYVTPKNNVIGQRLWVVNQKTYDMLVFEVLHNRHAVGSEENVTAKIFNETSLYGKYDYALLGKIFVLNQKDMKWKVTTDTSLLEDSFCSH